MWHPRLPAKLAGASAVAGGTVWIVHTVLLAVRPVGCVGGACFELGRRHRESEDLAWLLLLAVLMLALNAGAVVRGGFASRRKEWVSAFLLLAAGAVMLGVGLVLNSVSPGGSPLWLLHDSDTLGRLLPVAGTLMAGVGLARVPGARWLGWLLVVSAVIGIGFNAQDHRVLLSIPVGAAWVAYGLFFRPDSAGDRKGRQGDRLSGRGTPAHAS